MSSDFIPKRPHKKSRGGCGTSQLPAPPDLSSTSPDSNALLNSEDGVEDIERSWDLTVGPSFPAVDSSLGILSPTDLRYMHHWSTSTWKTLAVGNWADNVLKTELPSLAFEHNFLMNTMLGIASLHSQQLLLDPRQAQVETSMYRAKALRQFREALQDISFGSRKYEAALICSLMVVILCSKDYPLDDGELIIVNWLIMYRGLSSVISFGPGQRIPCLYFRPCRDPFAAIRSLSVFPIFRREVEPLTIPPVIPKILVNMLRKIGPRDPDFGILESLCKALDALGILFGQLQESGVSPSLSIRVITYPSYVSNEFAYAAQAKRPRTLVILAHYMVFIKLVRDLWWVDGIAEREFRTLLGSLGPEWYPYVEVPMMAMMSNSDEEIMALMLQ
ncbi:C6 zinc finger domain protein [Drepanopeziza brunnea f. sp. 'multigermtubi' MB_m1]|uniref:C6 zinc finger domain protein n=1 Tax=Marssonina brunnea f. sp. multigermtubi (strain MB_m1) TaxID=1072389 RepID=K1X6D2_MARBU|nr:C6 zinc finger domain protein [Drepanopeziza brunnea f. sp. 'multigermtubi' MB_m1]EKD16193.1 C6 zinc finger domain protein [Drepanopeziza brunnea f. sp. 'multigermtubi' MB_m1]